MKSSEKKDLQEKQAHWRDRIEMIEKWISDHDQDDPNTPQMMGDLRNARFQFSQVTK